MKAGHKTTHTYLLDIDYCIEVYNFHNSNTIAHYMSTPDCIVKSPYLTGVWIPKGTKRPDNWPNKK